MGRKYTKFRMLTFSGLKKVCSKKRYMQGSYAIFNFCFLSWELNVWVFTVLFIMPFMSEIFHNKKNRLKFLTTAFQNPVWFHKYLSVIFQNRL